VGRRLEEDGDTRRSEAIVELTGARDCLEREVTRLEAEVGRLKEEMCGEVDAALAHPAVKRVVKGGK